MTDYCRPNGTSIFTPNLLDRILTLSFIISSSSPPMKPFFRFSKDTDELFHLANLQNRNLFWDFDDSLQKILLNIVKSISRPDQLAQTCVYRWKINLESLYQTKKRELKELAESKRPYQFSNTARINFILDRLPQESRFLYVGCGSGTECLSLANQGHSVVGIDTVFKLTKIANRWSKYLDLPCKAVCMDVMNLGFSEETFDSFLIEFYGYQPSLQQSLFIQKNMAQALRKGAQGFVVGCRKNYASYWFLMKELYPKSMSGWLINQAFLDYHWDKPDGHEEKLVYGLYYRSHSVDSLSKELSYAFKVIECLYEKDPRYVIAIVEPKDSLDSLPDLESPQDWEGNVLRSWPESGSGSIPDIVGKIEAVCNLLESHERNLSEYFKNDSIKNKNPFRDFNADVPEFLRLLESTFRDFPDFSF